jgi:hypothetical protein
MRLNNRRSNCRNAILAVTLVLAALLIGPASALAETLLPDSGAAVHYETSPSLRSITPGRAGGKAFPARPTPPLPSSFSQTSAQDTSGAQTGAAHGAQLASPLIPSTSANFEGLDGSFCFCAPPDPSGAAGPNQYVEVVNNELAVYSKTGTVLLGPEPTKTLWEKFGGGCQQNNNGDATVLFDTINQRWVIQQFSVGTTPYLDCIAVSSSSDATGSWHLYSFQYEKFPDYPKMGIWPDGYYMSYNLYEGASGPFLGSEVCALNRAAMLAGNAATQQCHIVGSASQGSSLLPATLDGSTPPPSGAPEWLVALSPTTANALAYWKFHVDWSNPANTTFTGPTNLPVQAFSKACGGGTCIPQSETTQQLESLGDRLMFRLAYRNFGDHEALVVSHSVVAGTSVGTRWYELRPSAGSLTVYQQGTYAPDSSYRWMGSIAMDKAGDMGLGYSASSSSLHPQIRYTGRLVSDPLGAMPQGEGTIVGGAGSQTGTNQWGDYSEMTIDPSDECTFWYVNEYIPSNGALWHTRIGSFKFPNCDAPPTAVTKPASSVGPTKATLNGTVTPNGSATTYQFEYGTTTAYGSKVPATPKSIGSASPVEVNEKIEGLLAKTTYHFRVVATNAKGTTLGNDQTFTTPSSNPSWVAHSLNFPSGVTQVQLLGLGCSSLTTCTTVGGDFNGTWGAHAESGAGSGWAFQTGVTRNPGPKNGVLNGSSCPSTTWCMTVGSYGTSGGVPAMMAQAQNGSTWTLYNLGIPSGASRAELNAVSCTSSSFCMAVGYKMVSGDDKPFAMVFNGSTWVDSNAITAANATLKGVSCPTSTYCVAVGSTGGSALAEVWSGGSWSTTSEVVLPTGGSSYQLKSISCVSLTWCLTVGTYVTSSGNRAIASRWDGSIWHSVANLTWAVGTSPVAYGVSCITATQCFAVGTSSGQPFADEYNGVNPWTSMPLSVPSGATGGELRGISCVSSIHCEASGWSLFGGTPTGLIETYS